MPLATLAAVSETEARWLEEETLRCVYFLGGESFLLCVSPTKGDSKWSGITSAIARLTSLGTGRADGVLAVNALCRTSAVDGTLITGTVITAITELRICFLFVRGVTTSAITTSVEFRVSHECAECSTH